MSQLFTSMVELNEEAVISGVQKQLQEGLSPVEIIETLRKGMTEIGKRFEKHECFLTELMIAANIFTSAMDIIGPTLQTKQSAIEGLVVIGTPKGDIHDIGKNIVVALLQAEGIETIDLGVDVSSEEFVNTVAEESPRVLGMSALVTPSIYSMREVVEAVEEAGLRKNLVIIIGGGAVDRKVAEFVRADYYTQNAFSGVQIIKKILKEG